MPGSWLSQAETGINSGWVFKIPKAPRWDCRARQGEVLSVPGGSEQKTKKKEQWAPALPTRAPKALPSPRAT